MDAWSAATVSTVSSAENLPVHVSMTASSVASGGAFKLTDEESRNRCIYGGTMPLEP